MSAKLKLVEKSASAALKAEISTLRQRIALLEEVIDGFPGGIVLTDDNLNVIICNRYQRKLQEYPDSLFKSGTLKLADLYRFNAAHGEYGSADTESLIAAKIDLVKKREAHYFERTRPNGNVVEVRGVPLKNGGFVTSHTDVTENRRHQALIADLASTDPLTGLANRRLLQDHFNQACARNKRGEAFAMHYLDLDYFKPVNDKFGHKAGDAVLREVARRLKTVTRETDTVARIGGDEFIILQAGAKNERAAMRLAARLNAAIAKPILHDGHTLGVTASIGISVPDGEPQDLDEMMRQSDMALYKSKKNGRNCATIHESEKIRPRLRGAA